VRLGLHGGKLRGGDLDEVAKKEPEGLFRVPGIQQGLQLRVRRPRPVPRARQDSRFVQDEPTEVWRQEGGF
jgi:hypothetical protein